MACQQLFLTARTFFRYNFKQRMDAVGKALLQRVEGLLDARKDLDREDFRRAIARGRSWISEFLNGKRTTNDLRLVLKMAKFFSVSPSYLLNHEPGKPEDALTATMNATWPELDPEQRDIVLQLALRLRPRK